MGWLIALFALLRSRLRLIKEHFMMTKHVRTSTYFETILALAIKRISPISLIINLLGIPFKDWHGE